MSKACSSLIVGLLCATLTGPLSSIAGEIRLVSYNVENYLRMDRDVNREKISGAPKPEEEIAAVVRTITALKPDLLGLIEMGDESMLDDLQRRLREAGLDLPHREWVRGADANRHVCLLSRVPIVARNSRDEVPFELDGKSQRMSRGLLDVTVEPVAGTKLRLLGLHLKSRRSVPEFDQAALRAKEAIALREHIDGILKTEPATNLVAYGDFNDTKNEFPIKEIIGSPGSPTHMLDIWIHDSRGERWTHYWKAADLYSRIDYFFASPSMIKRIVWKKCGIFDEPFWSDASDHRAIFATLAFPDAP